MRKNSFIVFDLLWSEAIKELPECERREMYEAIFEFAQSGRRPEGLTGINLALWKVISDRIPDPADDDPSDTDTVEVKE